MVHDGGLAAAFVTNAVSCNANADLSLSNSHILDMCIGFVLVYE